MAKDLASLDLRKILEDYGQAGVDAAVQCVDDAANRLMAASKDRANSNFNGTGKMLASFHIDKPKRAKGRYKVQVICDAVNPRPVKNPGSHGSKRGGSYPNGYPYPRVLEWSPKYGKPFFFQDYYETKAALPDQVSEAIRKAVSNK